MLNYQSVELQNANWLNVYVFRSRSPMVRKVRSTTSLDCRYFFNITHLFGMGYISEGESSKVKQQWKICHNFQGWIIQDLPHLTQFCTQQARIDTWKTNFNINTVWRKAMSPLRLEPPTLRSKQDLELHLQAALRDFVFPAFSAPWYSGR